MNGQAAPRYTRIVAELRQRIESGELAPGDRVPSTREITRQWGVAMATATKVLTELRHQGLVRAVPGVGTVVEPGVRPERPEHPERPVPARRRSTADQALTLERIVEVAVAVADVEGLAAASMRRVAAELEVATMSLYRHVADKDALLLEMMDAAFRRWPLPENPSEGWRERLELVARTLWGMFRRHPWLAPALSFTRPQMVAGALPFSEWTLAALDGRGLDPSTAFTAHLTLFNYVRGTAVNIETEAEAEALSGLDSEEWMASQEPALHAILATDRFPRLRHLATTGYDFDLDALFEFGLQRLLDGLAVLFGEAT
ncbi:TetR/AcrR family transcriptional regulator C-terminal domain-containing protein [Streptomyces hesseae]|uniref:TetR/AcrR family transcriptional regulator C-terminal domain-containing protein n=1 Tax=Streptomyces hesseae TaxID=3075519 RepID=A0ABU2SL70_9ACTN|nr:TetR/AcrR family transcriptional regulator C-terminal domain-containing protein [Streptomyces sp. DSM 40473]MDT0449727.1 TetR/AcrR family transcriptional regulator C-terminal domain-containing protein [Streptomyces sp. DSM 40473]